MPFRSLHYPPCVHILCELDLTQFGHGVWQSMDEIRSVTSGYEGMGHDPGPMGKVNADSFLLHLNRAGQSNNWQMIRFDISVLN